MILDQNLTEKTDQSADVEEGKDEDFVSDTVGIITSPNVNDREDRTILDTQEGKIFKYFCINYSN